MTTLGELKQGARINLEIDLVARYVLRAGDVATQTCGDFTLDKALARSGYK
jgi:riboflavin synthase alpha subunit